MDWGTKIFNYGRAEVRNFLLGNALFWLERYHIDGLRVDAVASMLYLDYSRKAGRVGAEHPRRQREPRGDRLPQDSSTRSATASTPGSSPPPRNPPASSGVSRPTYLGGLGFSLKWNMGWMNDTLKYFEQDPIHRKYEPRRPELQPDLRLHRELHPAAVARRGRPRQGFADRQDAGRRLAEVRQPPPPLRLHVRPPRQEAPLHGRRARPMEASGSTTSRSTGTCSGGATTRASSTASSDLNALYKSEPSLHQVDFDWQGFEWLELHDSENSVLAFLRRGKNPSDFLVAVCNFTPVVREDYRVGVPNPRLLPRDLQHRRRGLRGLERRQLRRHLGPRGRVGRTAVPHFFADFRRSELSSSNWRRRFSIGRAGVVPRPALAEHRLVRSPRGWKSWPMIDLSGRSSAVPFFSTCCGL